MFFRFVTAPIDKYLASKRKQNQQDAEAILQKGLDELKQESKVIVNTNLIPNKNTFRPMTFDQYIGQEKAKTILKARIEGTKKMGVTFPHTLIYGKAGCGKTSLAKIIAKELGVSFQEIISTSIKEPKEIFKVIREANGGIIFLDEVHALKRELVEPLYPVMEDFRLGNDDLKPFTIIGATTEIGEILENRRPFYDRFKRHQSLEDYTAGDIEKIAKQYTEKLFPNEKVDPIVFQVIGINSRYTPRIAIGLLESVIHMGGNYRLALRSEGILLDGFTEQDLLVLEILTESPKGLGLQAIASRLETSKKNFEYDIQPYLFKNGLITLTRSGRLITDKGKEMMKRMQEIKGNSI